MDIIYHEDEYKNDPALVILTEFLPNAWQAGLSDNGKGQDSTNQYVTEPGNSFYMDLGYTDAIPAAYKISETYARFLTGEYLRWTYNNPVCKG